MRSSRTAIDSMSRQKSMRLSCVGRATGPGLARPRLRSLPGGPATSHASRLGGIEPRVTRCGRSGGPATKIAGGTGALTPAQSQIKSPVKSLSFLVQQGKSKETNVVVTGSWFPIFALFRGGGGALYDRTAGKNWGDRSSIFPSVDPDDDG